MDTERFSKPELEDRPLYYIRDFIEKKFEGDPLSWKEAEAEVILDKLKSEGVDTTMRLGAKVKMIKFLQEHGVHDLIEDPLRVVYAAEVLNNIDSVFYDPEFVPHVTSLEMAYFIQQVKKLGGLATPEDAPHAFKKVCSYVLSEEGYYEPPFPFVFLSKEDLYPRYMSKEEIPETDKELQSNKQKGIDQYLRLMAKLDL